MQTLPQWNTPVMPVSRGVHPNPLSSAPKGKEISTVWEGGYSCWLPHRSLINLQQLQDIKFTHHLQQKKKQSWGGQDWAALEHHGQGVWVLMLFTWWVGADPSVVLFPDIFRTRPSHVFISSWVLCRTNLCHLLQAAVDNISCSSSPPTVVFICPAQGSDNSKENNSSLITMIYFLFPQFSVWHLSWKIFEAQLH